MKKILSGILALVLLSTMLSTVLAAPFPLSEDGSITIELPEGMTGTNESNEGGFMASIAVNDNASLQYACFISYSEEMVGRQINVLSEEEEAELVETLAATMEEGTYEFIEIDEVPILAVESSDLTQIYLVFVSDGWTCTVAAYKNDGVALTDEEIEVALTMLSWIEIGETEA